jgi:hypothetical protein
MCAQTCRATLSFRRKDGVASHVYTSAALMHTQPLSGCLRLALAPGACSEKDAQLAQKLGQRQPFTAVFPQECIGQLAPFGPT